MLTIVDQSSKKSENLYFGSYKWNKNSLVGIWSFSQSVNIIGCEGYKPYVLISETKTSQQTLPNRNLGEKKML